MDEDVSSPLTCKARCLRPTCKSHRWSSRSISPLTGDGGGADYSVLVHLRVRHIVLTSLSKVYLSCNRSPHARYVCNYQGPRLQVRPLFLSVRKSSSSERSLIFAGSPVPVERLQCLLLPIGNGKVVTICRRFAQIHRQVFPLPDQVFGWLYRMNWCTSTGEYKRHRGYKTRFRNLPNQ